MGILDGSNCVLNISHFVFLFFPSNPLCCAYGAHSMIACGILTEDYLSSKLVSTAQSSMNGFQVLTVLLALRAPLTPLPFLSPSLIPPPHLLHFLQPFPRLVMRHYWSECLSKPLSEIPYVHILNSLRDQPFGCDGEKNLWLLIKW